MTQDGEPARHGRGNALSLGERGQQRQWQRRGRQGPSRGRTAAAAFVCADCEKRASNSRPGFPKPTGEREPSRNCKSARPSEPSRSCAPARPSEPSRTREPSATNRAARALRPRQATERRPWVGQLRRLCSPPQPAFRSGAAARGTRELPTRGSSTQRASAQRARDRAACARLLTGANADPCWLRTAAGGCQTTGSG